MAKLSEKIQAELDNIIQVLAEINKIKDKKKSTAELAGLATFLHNFYSGIENILTMSFDLIQLLSTNYTERYPRG